MFLSPNLLNIKIEEQDKSLFCLFLIYSIPSPRLNCSHPLRYFRVCNLLMLTFLSSSVFFNSFVSFFISANANCPILCLFSNNVGLMMDLMLLYWFGCQNPSLWISSKGLISQYVLNGFLNFSYKLFCLSVLQHSTVTLSFYFIC